MKTQNSAPSFSDGRGRHQQSHWKTLLLGFLSFLLLGETPVAAAVKTWVHGAANNNFSANGNWSPTGSPAVAAPGDDLVFGSDNSVKPNLNDTANTSTNYSSVTFTNGGFTLRTAIDGRLMRIKAGGGITNRTGFSNSDNQIGPHVVMLGAMTVMNENVASKLIFIPDDRNADKYTIDGGNNALTFDGAGDFIIGSVAPNMGEMKNIGSLTKKGAGVLELCGTNIWNGNSDVQGGTFRLSTVNDLQGSISIKNGATLSATIDSVGTSLRAHTLTMGTAGSDVTTNTFELGALGNPITNVISVSNLTVNGTIFVNVTGWGLRPGQFPLIKYQTLNGDGGNILSNQFPSGVTGYLSNNIANKSIDAVIVGPVVPQQADPFVDSIGVNVHIAIYTQPDFAVYNYSNTLAAVQSLGLRHVRDGFGYWSAEDERNTFINNLATNGIRFQATIGGVPSSQINDYAASLVVAANNVDPGALEWIEGVNEPNIFDLFMSPQDIFDLQAALWNNFKADPDQHDLPILMPSLAGADAGNGFYANAQDLANQLAALGIQQFADYNNAHPYPNTPHKPEGLPKITESLEINQTLGPDLPLIVSETQYSTPTPPKASGVDEWAAGIYTPRLLMELNERGVKNISIYELFDVPNEGGNFSFAGLFHSDGTVPGTIKPQGAALKNMIGLLADPGPSFSVTNLDFILSGGSIRTKLFQKRNGEYWLALWRPVDVGYWDGAAFVQNYPTPHDVTLTFNCGFVPAGITTYTDLGNNTMTTATLTAASNVIIPEVGSMVKFVRITGSMKPFANIVIDPPYLEENGKLIIAGHNLSAMSGGSYTVLSSTNVVAPLSAWATNLSGTFGNGGSFSNAIELEPSDAQRFFIIRVP